MWQTFWDWLVGVKGQTMVAGAAGGLVRWLVVRENWRKGVPILLVGTLCALYLTPLVMPALEPVVGSIVLDPESKAGFSGFLIGVGGISVASFFIDFWSAWRRDRNGRSTKRRDDGA